MKTKRMIALALLATMICPTQAVAQTNQTVTESCSFDETILSHLGVTDGTVELEA